MKTVQFITAGGSRITIEAPGEKVDSLMREYYPNVVIQEKVEK